MSAPRPRLRFWPAWVLVATVHVATTAGTWLVTDQSEAIYTARHLVEHGNLTLREDGSRPPELPFLRTRPAEPTRSRQLPLTMLSHMPLVLLDKLFGLERPGDYGRFVHLQGHLLVLAALALIGVAIERSTGSPRGAAFAVAATGLCWPVWMASRNGCAEPVEMLLVTAWLVLGPDVRPASEALTRVRAACCFLLSWVNPAGSALAVALAAAAALREPRRAATWQVAGAGLGVASVFVLWNGLLHGNLLVGGYSRLSILDLFTIDTLGRSVLVQLQATALQGLVLGGLAAWLCWRTPAARAAALAPALLYAAVFALFAAFVLPEPERRFAPVWPAFGLFVGLHYARLGLRNPWPQALLGFAFVLGFRDFFATAGRSLLGPDGLFWPGVLWVRLLLDGAPPAAVGAVLLGHFLLALAAAERVARLVRDEGTAGSPC